VFNVAIEFTKNAAVYIKDNAPNIKIVNTTIRNCLGSGIYLENFQKIQNIQLKTV
jgi:ribosomal protein L14